MCRFDAISDDFVVDPTLCEGCGVCCYFCPADAVEFPLNTCGEWMISDTRFGPLVHAHLGIGEENSGKLVSLVRRKARDLAEKKGVSLILTDGPPGIGCPVIAAIGGADAVLIVTEPTVSGIHDMKRVVELANHFSVPAMVSVNKYDLNPKMTHEIERFGRQNGLELVGNIPFDPVFTEAMVVGQSICEAEPKAAGAVAARAIWDVVREKIGA
jgi:MinD superfamily P-loop ATPase